MDKRIRPAAVRCRPNLFCFTSDCIKNFSRETVLSLSELIGVRPGRDCFRHAVRKFYVRRCVGGNRDGECDPFRMFLPAALHRSVNAPVTAFREAQRPSGTGGDGKVIFTIHPDSRHVRKEPFAHSAG